MSKQARKVPVQIVRLSILALVVVVFIGYKFLSKEMLESRLDKLFAGTPKGMITYHDASINIFTMAIKIYDLEIHVPSREPIMIKEVDIDAIDTKHETPRFMDVKLDGINVDLQALSRVNPMAASIIKSLGYDELSSDIRMDYKFDKDAKMLDIKEMSWRLKNAGKLTYEAKLYNVDSLAGLMMQIQLSPQSLQIGKVVVKYKDRSLTNRVIKLLAQQSGKTPDLYKKELIEKLETNLKTAQQNNSSFNEKFGKAFIGFIKDPDEFKISVSPSEPIPISELQNMQNPKELSAKLNIKISND